MRHWITYNCKMFGYHIFLYILALMCCLIYSTSQASDYSVNVYLKLKAKNPVVALINDLNQFLQEHQIVSSYQIKPFINDHPLHITLYLATYDQKQLVAIMKQTESIAKQHKPITIITEQFVASPTGYLKLSLKSDQQITQLSTRALYALAPLRKINAPIPSWAVKDKLRRQLFIAWGSPSVMDYFSPHFSVFDPDHLNSIQQHALYKKLGILIKQFSRIHASGVTTTADAIGVGIADSHGQIVREVGVFQLAG